ncbi:MAG TPA: hypothetical protein VF190_03065 [Rhodothermales bacterium]
MRTIRVAFTVHVLLLLAGCNTGRSASAPVLATRSDVYGPGDRIAVTLENDTSTPIGYNICYSFLMLERRTDTGWEAVEVSLAPDPTSACTLELKMLAPDEQAEGVAYLPAELEAGTYRLATDVEVESVREMVATDPFEVRV